MTDIRRNNAPPEPGGLFAPVVAAAKPAVFAANDPPRATARQATRWATQDAAYATRPGSMVARVVDAIRESPATCDELEVLLAAPHQTISPAVNAAMRRGLIVADGARPTRSGRSARVWRIADC